MEVEHCKHMQGSYNFFCDRTLLLYHIDHCINVGAEAGAEVGT